MTSPPSSASTSPRTPPGLPAPARDGSRRAPGCPRDSPELIRLRGLLFSDLAVTWGSPPPGGQWRGACAEALAQALADEATRVSVMSAIGGLAACGLAAIDRRRPSPFNPGGWIGHVFGIVTDLACRRRGHARAIMLDLLGWLDHQGVARTGRNASPDGQGLYCSLGFTGHPDPVLSRMRPPR